MSTSLGKPFPRNPLNTTQGWSQLRLSAICTPWNFEKKRKNIHVWGFEPLPFNIQDNLTYHTTMQLIFATFCPLKINYHFCPPFNLFSSFAIVFDHLVFKTYNFLGLNISIQVIWLILYNGLLGCLLVL